MISSRPRWATLVLIAATALTAMAVFSATAFAETPDPTMGLVALQAKLDASPTHSVPGYFKTVLQGSTISTIPCTVLSIAGETSSSASLILFRASGQAISDIGGIASGMSGSPIYVQDAGEDKIVGAVSYGDDFTIGGTGLATPIEAMLQLQQTYAPHIESLTRPVFTDGRTINRVIVVPNPQDFAGAATTGAFVARPLSETFVGGLRPDSKAFLDLQKDLAAKGITLTARNPAAAGSSSLDTPLVPGASVAALQARGDLWIGSVGTVTYADEKDVLAYGHPAGWTGESDLFMCNATIDGVWPNQQAPYKMARPATLKGTITQDRTAGILGKLDLFPTVSTVHVHATNADTGQVADTSVQFPSSLVSAGTLGYPAFGAAVYVGGDKLFDTQYVGGSADVTTTVVFGDGVHTYSAVLPNMLDDSSTLLDQIPIDAESVVLSLDRTLGDELTTMTVDSVDVQVRFTKKRRSATLLSINAPNGLKHGDNRIEVQLKQFGVAETRTVDTTLTIPADDDLGGMLSAQGVDEFGYSIAPYEASSVAEVADALQNYWSPNNVFFVSYGHGPDDVDSIDTTVATPWEVIGRAAAIQTHVNISAFPATVNYRGTTTISGLVSGGEESLVETVGVYATQPGQPEKFLGEADLTPASSWTRFSFQSPPLSASAVIRVHVDAFAGYDSESNGNMSADASVRINVRAKVSPAFTSASVRAGNAVGLSVSVAPTSTAGGQVTFEYFDTAHQSWRKIATRTLKPAGNAATAAAPWKALKGTHKIRVRYLGGVLNAATTSATFNIRGK